MAWFFLWQIQLHGILSSERKEVIMKKETIVKITKYLLDFMFFAGILVTLTLPLSVKWLGKYLDACKTTMEKR